MIGNSGFRLHHSENADDRSKDLDVGNLTTVQRSRSRDLGLVDQFTNEALNIPKTTEDINDLSTGFATTLNFDLDFQQQPASNSTRRIPLRRTGSDDLTNIWSDSIDRLSINKPISSISQGFEGLIGPTFYLKSMMKRSHLNFQTNSCMMMIV